MHRPQQIDPTLSVPLPTVLESAGNSGKIARVDTSNLANQKPGVVDAKTVEREFKTVEKQLRAEIPRLVSAKQSIDEVVPLLARVQALLSQRGAARNALRNKHLPTWTSFVSSFAAEIGYSPRQLRNLIRAHREPQKITRGSKSPNCKPVLLGLLAWIETSGDHLPLILVDVLRNAKTYLEGHQNSRQWKKVDQDLRERYRRHEQASNALVAETSQVLGSHSYVM